MMPSVESSDPYAAALPISRSGRANGSGSSSSIAGGSAPDPRRRGAARARLVPGRARTNPRAARHRLARDYGSHVPRLLCGSAGRTLAAPRKRRRQDPVVGRRGRPENARAHAEVSRPPDGSRGRCPGSGRGARKDLACLHDRPERFRGLPSPRNPSLHDPALKSRPRAREKRGRSIFVSIDVSLIESRKFPPTLLVGGPAEKSSD